MKEQLIQKLTKPEGEEYKWEVVRVVVIAPVENAEKSGYKETVIVFKRPGDSNIDCHKYHLPGGGYDKNGNILEEVAKKLKKETGLEVSPSDLRPVGDYDNQDTKKGFWTLTHSCVVELSEMPESFSFNPRENEGVEFIPIQDDVPQWEITDENTNRLFEGKPAFNTGEVIEDALKLRRIRQAE